VGEAGFIGLTHFWRFKQAARSETVEAGHYGLPATPREVVTCPGYDQIG